MKRTLLMIIAVMACTLAFGQSADKLYEQAKALYDAKNYTAAIPKLQAAASKGHKKAQYRLGYCYDKGKGVAEDDSKAFYWYGKSAAQGYAKAQYQLGRCYKKAEGTPKDLVKAAAYFSKAAQQGNADGQYALGKCYMKGQGVQADVKKAKSWFQKAIRNEKGGDKILKEIREDAAAGDKDAVQILTMLGLK